MPNPSVSAPLSDAQLAAKYDLRLPRYTSYPTALQFTPAITATHFAQWLGALDAGAALSLYLHIPYCRVMCHFCGCHTKLARRYEPVADYLEALLAEIRTLAAHLPARMKVSHIHFGGGSPTALSRADFARVMAALSEHFHFLPNAEIAVEMDPRTASEDYVQGLAQCGVNRASLGVQDFNTEVQQAIGRIQPLEVTERTLQWLRAAGIGAINLDLMYGLPKQTCASLLESVAQTVALKPARVSLFGYAHVPWMKRHQRLIVESDLPGAEERWRQYRSACAALRAAGYAAIGLDHFAQPGDTLVAAQQQGKLHRNFQGYTTDTAPALIGFGASAISRLPQGFAANEIGIEAYKQSARSGALMSNRGVAFTGDDALRSSIIERLMCDLRLDLAEQCARFCANPAEFDEIWQRLGTLEEDGLLRRLPGWKLEITETGRPLVRAACALFDRYLPQGEQRHSRAV